MSESVYSFVFLCLSVISADNSGAVSARINPYA